jgi:photosystem II stability/assembly factor-like uncharacterized protein
MIRKARLVFGAMTLVGLAACSTTASTPESSPTITEPTRIASATPPLPTPGPHQPTLLPTVQIAPTHSAPSTTPTPVPNPIPRLAPGTALTVTSIHMLDASNGWGLGGVGGQGDHVLRTSDGGQTWTDVTPPEASDPVMTALGFFLDDQTAWVIYASAGRRPPETAVTWRTLDGGTTWQASQNLDAMGVAEQFFPSYLTFTDDQHGWLMVGVGAGMSHAYVVLYRTEDGGMTWARLLDPYTDGGIQSLGKTGMVFADPQTGWLTRDNYGVMTQAFFDRTADGGTTWEIEVLPAPPADPGLFDLAQCWSHSAFLSSPTDGRVALTCRLYREDPPTTTSLLYRTTDGGGTWRFAPVPDGEIVFIDANTVFALGREIRRSNDGGRTWSLVKTVNWDGQFSFVTADLAWAVAANEDGTSLVRTTNGCATWQLIEPVIGRPP